MYQGNFSCHSRSYACRCMQGDRLPYSVSPLGCHLMRQTKFSSSVGAVHLKAIFAGMGGNEPKVVQKGPAKGNFLVDNRAVDATDGEVPKNISPNTVIAEVASNRSTAALANGVSGIRTPASDSRRVIVAITELLLLAYATSVPQKPRDRSNQPWLYSRRHSDVCGHRCRRKGAAASGELDRALRNRSRARRRIRRLFE